MEVANFLGEVKQKEVAVTHSVPLGSLQISMQPPIKAAKSNSEYQTPRAGGNTTFSPRINPREPRSMDPGLKPTRRSTQPKDVPNVEPGQHLV